MVSYLFMLSPGTWKANSSALQLFIFSRFPRVQRLLYKMMSWTGKNPNRHLPGICVITLPCHSNCANLPSMAQTILPSPTCFTHTSVSLEPSRVFRTTLTKCCVCGYLLDQLAAFPSSVPWKSWILYQFSSFPCVEILLHRQSQL